MRKLQYHHSRTAPGPKRHCFNCCIMCHIHSDRVSLSVYFFKIVDMVSTKNITNIVTVVVSNDKHNQGLHTLYKV